MEIERLSKDKVIRPSLIDAVDKINEVINGVESIDRIVETIEHSSISTHTTTGDANGSLISVTANGHAEQDGTPTPSDPKEIRVVRGRNLLDVSQYLDASKTNCTIEVEDDVLTMAATGPDRDAYFGIAGRAIGTTYTSGYGQKISCVGGETYTFNISNESFKSNYFVFFDQDDRLIATTSGDNFLVFTSNHGTFTVPENARYFTMRAGVNAAVIGSTYATTIQLELGSTVHPYVPYGHVGLDVTADGITTTTPIPLPSRGWVGSLPDGTHDALAIDGAGRVTWELADAAVRISDLSFEYDSTNQRFVADVSALGVRGIRTSRLVPMLSDSFVVKWHGEAYDASWDGVAYIGGDNLVLHARDYDNVTDLENALANTAFYYPLATPTTEDMGYVDMPDIPEGAVVSMPELENLSVESWNNDVIYRYVNALVARAVQ